MTKRPDLDTIGGLLADIRGQFEALRAAGDRADPIEVELFEATVSFLSANVSVFRKTFVPLESVTEAIPPRRSAENQPQMPVSENDFVANEIHSTAMDEVDPEGDEMHTEIVDAQPEMDDMRTEVVEVEPEINEVDTKVDIRPEFVDTPELTSSVEPEPAIVFESVPEVEASVRSEPVPEAEPAPARPLSLNEILANKRHPNTEGRAFANRMEHARSTDLKTAINLNDKLLFIKDLFNGYSLAYSEAIELLNRYDSMSEAEAFLQSNYAVKNDWASKPETAAKFYQILQKRFG